MFSLRLIIPTAETSPWEYSPNALRSRRFLRLADGTGVILASVSAPGRVSANPFRLFLSPASHTFTDQGSAGSWRQTLCRHLEFIPFVALSSAHTALPTRDALVCPGCQLPLFNSRSVPGPI